MDFGVKLDHFSFHSDIILVLNYNLLILDYVLRVTKSNKASNFNPIQSIELMRCVIVVLLEVKPKHLNTKFNVMA